MREGWDMGWGKGGDYKTSMATFAHSFKKHGTKRGAGYLDSIRSFLELLRHF